MLAVAREIRPALARCGPKAVKSPGAEPDPALCVKTTPQVIVGGRGVSGTAFLANPQYRAYLFEQLHAETFEMEHTGRAGPRGLRQRDSLHRVPQPQRPGRRRGVQRRRRGAVRQRPGGNQRGWTSQRFAAVRVNCEPQSCASLATSINSARTDIPRPAC